MRLSKRQVQTVSSLPLDTMERIELVLILLGEKPATDLFLKVDGNFSEEYLQSLLAKIRSAGLVCCAERKELFLESWSWGGKNVCAYERVLVIVEKTKKNLAALREARDTKNDEELGKLYGFPETAVKAFVGKDGFTRVEIEDEPQEIKGCEYGFLLGFFLSQENWQDEIGQTRGRFNLLVDEVPRLVEEHIEKERNSDAIRVVARSLTDDELRLAAEEERRILANLKSGRC